MTGFHWFPVMPTLSEWRGGCWEVLGSENLELDASVYWLEAGGEMQLSVTDLEDEMGSSEGPSPPSRLFVPDRTERAT